jgi:hypothetical protein
MKVYKLATQKKHFDAGNNHVTVYDGPDHGLLQVENSKGVVTCAFLSAAEMIRLGAALVRRGNQMKKAVVSTL